MKQNTFNLFVWFTVFVSVLLPTIAWGNNIVWRIGTLTAYQWFPLFGLLAWMLMATHYFTGALRTIYPSLQKPRYYSKSTSYAVLACLLLHPGILAYSEWRNGAGLPPASFTNYVGESLMLASFLGTLGLGIFLAYEVFDRIKNKPSIKRNWRFVSLSQSVAMTLIFVHALRLGGELEGWFLLVWLFYGALLLACFYVIHRSEFVGELKKSVDK